jgi:hypothetical protein
MEQGEGSDGLESTYPVPLSMTTAGRPVASMGAAEELARFASWWWAELTSSASPSPSPSLHFSA